MFKLHSPFSPAGDQIEAIEKITSELKKGKKHHTLLGVTGSGKTFTVANIISKIKKTTLIVSHNKTLAAQLYSELKQFFPSSKVEYFISYYDYYLPEAYIPQTDTYIAKDSSINKELERFRLSTTCSLLMEKEVIVIASVSAIYGLGLPEEIIKHKLNLKKNMQIDRDALLKKLVDIHYTRNDLSSVYGNFTAKGDRVDVYLAYTNEYLRVEFWGNEIERLSLWKIIGNEYVKDLESIDIFPAKHFVADKSSLKEIIFQIKKEMIERIKFFEGKKQLVEAQRIAQRTKYDMEILQELGYCSGIENYSRYFTNRAEGSRPYTLLDFFPEDFLLIVDESHITLPQFGGMYEADKSRKLNLIKHGFRLPSALDNRPMNFSEFEKSINQAIYVSATPRPYELNLSGSPIEMIVRPTGLVDPIVKIEKLDNQIDVLIKEVRLVISRKERVLIACLTKKNAEDLSDYLKEVNIKTHYLHSEIDSIERISIIRDLREGKVDCLVGINLLREGIDLPEVSLVLILDADKEGFLRSETAFIQIAGRAARNLNGKVVLFADKITKSIESFLKITSLRRKKQIEYNKENNFVPKNISRSAQISLKKEKPNDSYVALESSTPYNKSEIAEQISILKKEMLEAADNLEFEKAADYRDSLLELEKKLNNK